MNKPFNGFSGNNGFSSLPNEFFGDLLSQIDNLIELKVVLYALWLVANMEGAGHPLFVSDFAMDLPVEQIAEGLEKCVLQGSLLRVTREADETVYFINSPRGRASAEAARAGHWIPSKKNNIPPLIRSNIFNLYEENIGALTPMIADTLRDAEEEYENEKIAEAIELAVKANARNWRYVEAILKRWKEEGYGENRRNNQKDRSRYTQDKYADFFD